MTGSAASDDFDASRPDGGGVRAALAGLPQRLATLATREWTGLALPTGEGITGVVVCAAGDDAIDADLVVAMVSIEASVPVVVCRGGRLPGWVGPTTLVIVVALTRTDDRSRHVLEAAVHSGADVVAITADPAFAADAVVVGARVHALEVGDVTPRLLPGIVLVPLLGLFEAVGLFPGAGGPMTAALAQAALVTSECAAAPEGRRRAATATLARHVDRTLPLVYGADGVAGTAAKWWKSAVNQSAKLPAFADAVPAMTYSEFAMFGQAGDLTRQVFTMILLRPPADTEGSLAAGQLDRFDELFSEVVADVMTVTTEAHGVAAYLDLAIRGEWVGLELANLAGVDPSAVSYLEELWAESAD